MAERGISNGPNSRPLNDTVATTGPGLADDALAAGETLDDAIGAEDDALSGAELACTVFGDDDASKEAEAHPS